MDILQYMISLCQYSKWSTDANIETRNHQMSKKENDIVIPKHWWLNFLPEYVIRNKKLMISKRIQ